MKGRIIIGLFSQRISTAVGVLQVIGYSDLLENRNEAESRKKLNPERHLYFNLSIFPWCRNKDAQTIHFFYMQVIWFCFEIGIIFREVFVVLLTIDDLAICDYALDNLELTWFYSGRQRKTAKYIFVRAALVITTVIMVSSNSPYTAESWLDKLFCTDHLPGEIFHQSNGKYQRRRGGRSVQLPDWFILCTLLRDVYARIRMYYVRPTTFGKKWKQKETPLRTRLGIDL